VLLTIHDHFARIVVGLLTVANDSCVCVWGGRVCVHQMPVTTGPVHGVKHPMMPAYQPYHKETAIPAVGRVPMKTK